MTDDDPSRGLNQENIFGVAYDSVGQPNHIETVIVEIDDEIWKYSRYFDNIQFWSDPETPEDVVINLESSPDTVGTHPVIGTKRVKTEPVEEEYEMYNATLDPMELNNLSSSPEYSAMEALLAELLQQQRALKRLEPISDEVPGAPDT